MELFKMKENSRFNKFYFRIAVILVFILCLFAMSRIEPVFTAYSGGAGILDMRFGYAAADVYQLFGKLGAEGRSLYIMNLCVDFIFIASFVFVQNFLLSWAMGKVVLNGKLRFLLSIAALRGLFDMIENILILIILLNYPTEFTVLAAASGIVTRIKFILLGVWMIAIPVSLIARGRVGRLGFVKERGKAE